MKSGFNLKERLDDLNLSSDLAKKAAVGVAIACLLFLVCYLYIHKIREMEDIKARIKQAEAGIQETNGTGISLKEAKERQKDLESRLRVLIPYEKDYPGLIREIARLARELNIQDITFKDTNKLSPNVIEGERQASPELSVLPGRDISHFSIGISFHSRFRDLAYFLQEIQGIGRFIEIDSLVIKRSFPMISVDMVIIVYYRQRSEDGGQRTEVRGQRSGDELRFRG